MHHCPLCKHTATQLLLQDKKRSFYCCEVCGLVFADPNSHLLPSVERQRYGRTQRSGKQRQLDGFIASLMHQLGELGQSNLNGLNFGRVLSESAFTVVDTAGYQLQQYDPFFAAQHALLQQQYDFICSYRVFEHFREPAKEWRLISACLKPNGWLTISTPLLRSLPAFAKWHLKNNPTHVSFYQPKTFAYLAQQYGFTLLFADGDFVLMQKAA
ncbi:class I SAM-dependent methyltransferase [Shewanella avicenniae]|uniref:Class I SAM-dependent methyltransferase n=1 Tax=Shewanella avicenniae TaxID=2814294 RepID=A0ABX7QRM3_9GAMM|nr:class I SAM-dependent methyltransferase [Shewanella avicenniae]QSX33640.1 class I SAM-dependent methyltransferase [Shewanella avicenniae]